MSRPVLLLHDDPVVRERFRRACTNRFDFRLVAGWDSLRDAIRAAPPSAIVVLDPYDGTGKNSRLSPELRTVLIEFPSATIFAACEVGRGSMDDLRQMGAWGVSRVLALDEENTPVAIARRLSTAQGRPLQSLLQRALPLQTPGRTRAILVSAAEVVAVGGTARDLARSLHVTTRTLLRWCQRARLPAPRQLLAWMRILLAAEILDDPGRSVLGVAFACGYSSDNALRNIIRKYLGVTPKVLRHQGAFDVASEAFLDSLGSLAARPAHT